MNYCGGFHSVPSGSHFSTPAKDVKEYLAHEDSTDIVHFYYMGLKLMPFTH